MQETSCAIVEGIVAFGSGFEDFFSRLFVINSVDLFVALNISKEFSLPCVGLRMFDTEGVGVTFRLASERFLLESCSGTLLFS